MNTNISNFYSSDFLSALIFGGGGFFVFYVTPFILFAYFYMQFRGNNQDITIEGLIFRYIFYSFIIIVIGGIIFSLLSAFSFSSISNATKGLYLFMQINWDDINNVLSGINNNTNLLESEKENIKYLALILMALKILFKSFSILPLMSLVYLTFVSSVKCKRIAISEGDNVSICLTKNFFYIFLFIIALFLIYKFADSIVEYLFKNYLDITLNDEEFKGIYNTSKEMFAEVKNMIISSEILQQ